MPNRTSGRTGNIVAPIVAASPAQPQESSSATIAAVTASTSAPPYSAGIRYDVSPSRAAFASRSAREVVALVPLGAIGRSSFAANSCASSRSSCCSGVSVNEIPPPSCEPAQNVKSSMPPLTFSPTPVM